MDEDGSVYFANHESSLSPATNGIAKFDGTSWSSYTSSNSGLPLSFIYALVATDEALYCGTANYGIAGFDGMNWSYYETENELHSNWITAMAQGTVADDTGLFFGTAYAGVALFDGTEWSSYTTENSDLGDNNINDLHISDGTLWVGAQYTGLWSFDGTSWDNYNPDNSSMLGDIVLTVDSDSQGNIWLGTSGWDGPMGQDGALSKFDGANWTNYYLSNSGLIEDHIQAIAFGPASEAWFATLAGQHTPLLMAWPMKTSLLSSLRIPIAFGLVRTAVAFPCMQVVDCPEWKIIRAS